MTKSKNAVEVNNIKKSFYLPNHRNDSIKTAITQVFRKKDKGVNTFNALNGVSFNVEKGEFFGILGRNGSGKSTLLKIISEIYQPTSGSVKHDGKVVSFIELGVGFNAELSGRENVYLNGALIGFSKKEVEAMYDDIVEFAELEKFMDQKLKNYSSGMKVRLAFSLAIRAHADILILDEVLAVGDAAFQKKCNDYFRSLKNDKKTVILVTHSMTAVREYCDKAVLIEGGKVILYDGPDVVADAYNNMFKTALNRDDGRFGGGEVVIHKTSAHVFKDKVDIKVHMNSGEDYLVDLAIDIYKNGRLVAGESTKNKDAIEVAKGRTTTSVSIPNIFGGGKYTVAVSIKSRSGDVYDFLKDAVSFENKFVKSEYLPVVLGADFKVNKE